MTYNTNPKFKEGWEAIKNVGPYDAYQASEAAENASKAAKEYAKDNGLKSEHNNDADAIRHAAWNIEMARKIGKDQAETIANIHEKLNPNDAAERKMDEHNNKVGREIANDPAYKDLTPRQAAEKALKDGKLIRHP